MSMNKQKTFTREYCAKMEPDAYTRLRDSYYRVSDGLTGLQEEAASMGTEERAALEELTAAFEKFSSLGKIL
jgi:hypothetical protein